jgi:hypothetical protein
MHSCVHAFMHSCMHACIRSFIRSFIPTSTHSSVESLDRSIIQSFIPSFHSFIQFFSFHFISVRFNSFQFTSFQPSNNSYKQTGALPGNGLFSIIMLVYWRVNTCYGNYVLMCGPGVNFSWCI